jgi:hypothetical protein
MVQPWAQEKRTRTRAVDVHLIYTFDAEAVPAGPLALALEEPQRYSIRINDRRVNPETKSGWWVDKSLRRIPLDPILLHTGRNEIRLRCRYDENHPGLEAIYLLGRFGARVKGASLSMTTAPESLKIGDWAQQGLPFYSGSVSYMWSIRPRYGKGQRVVVKVPDYRGAAVRVLVDGRQAGIICWEPNEVDVTDFLPGGRQCPKQARANLSIEVIGHRRNSHGPFHLKETWPVWTGPAEFVPEKENYFDGYHLVPCGLMRPVEIVIRERKRR